MDSTIYCLLLTALLAVVFVDGGAACKPAQSRLRTNGLDTDLEWYCPPGNVLFQDRGKHWCFKRCAGCPNGVCQDKECHCFPGTTRDRAGVCGKICPNCENGWCSSVSTCECNEGFTLSEGRCVRLLDRSREEGLLTSLSMNGRLSPPLLNHSPPQRDPFDEHSAHGYPQGSYHHRGRHGHRHDGHCIHGHASGKKHAWHAHHTQGFHDPPFNTLPEFPSQVHQNIRPPMSSGYYPQVSPQFAFQPSPPQLPSDYDAQPSPERPLRVNPPAHSGSSPQSPALQPPTFNDHSFELRPETSPPSPPQSNPKTYRPTILQKSVPKQNSDLPLSSDSASSSEFQQKTPPQRYPQPPSADHPSLSSDPSSEPVSGSSFGFHQESPPQRYPQPPSAERPDRPYQFETINPQVSTQVHVRRPSCPIDYLWDPEVKACVPYESVKPPKLDVRELQIDDK